MLGASLANITQGSGWWCLWCCLSIVVSDESCRQSVNKPMSGSEMEQQLLKHLQQECSVTQRTMTSRERAYSESSEGLSHQPLGALTYTYHHHHHQFICSRDMTKQFNNNNKHVQPGIIIWHELILYNPKSLITFNKIRKIDTLDRLSKSGRRWKVCCIR